MVAVKEFGMFSDVGNAGVETLVNFARVANLTWPETYNGLRKLADSNPDVYGILLLILVDQNCLICYNTCIVIKKELENDSNRINPHCSW